MSFSPPEYDYPQVCSGHLMGSRCKKKTVTEQKERMQLQHEGFRLDIHMQRKFSSASKSSETLEHRMKAELWYILERLKEKGRWFYFNALYSAPLKGRRMNFAIAGERSFLVL